MLIRTHLRLLRPVLIAYIVVAFVSYIILPINYLIFRQRYEQFSNHGWYPIPMELGRAVRNSCALIWLSLPALSAAIGGLAFAAERRGRMSEWLNMLPVLRTRFVFTRLIFSIGLCLLPLLINIGVIEASLVLHQSLGANDSTIDQETTLLAENIIIVGVISLAAFGVAWFLSALLDSPTIATAGAFGFVGGSFILVLQNCRTFDSLPSDPRWAIFSVMLIFALVGIGFIATGTQIEIQRTSL